MLLARSLLSGTAEDLAPLLREVVESVGVPVAGIVTDGQTSLRRAVERALPPLGRLDPRRQTRALRTRFRRDPQAYLKALELKACQPTFSDLVF